MFTTPNKILYIHLEDTILEKGREDLLDNYAISNIRYHIKLIEPERINIISRTCITKKDTVAFWQNAAPVIINSLGMETKLYSLLNLPSQIESITRYMKTNNSYISDRSKMGILNNPELSFYMYAELKYNGKDTTVYYLNRNIQDMRLFRRGQTDIVCLPLKYNFGKPYERNTSIGIQKEVHVKDMPKKNNDKREMQNRV